MKRLICVVVIAGFAISGMATEKKDLKEVRITDLIPEMMKQGDFDKEIYMSFWMPVEYWKVSILQSPNLSEEGKKQILKSLEPYFVVAVVRMKASPTGRLLFAGKEETIKGLKVSHVAKDGKVTVLNPVDGQANDMATVLNYVKTIYSQSMGKLGENCHFLIFRDRNADGSRIVSPYEKGQVIVDFAKEGKSQCKLTFECPINSFFAVKKCPGCQKEMKVSWNYCPWCGKKLPE